MSTITQMTNWEAADDITEGTSYGDVSNRKWCEGEMYWHLLVSRSGMRTHVRERSNPESCKKEVALFCGDSRYVALPDDPCDEDVGKTVVST